VKVLKDISDFPRLLSQQQLTEASIHKPKVMQEVNELVSPLTPNLMCVHSCLLVNRRPLITCKELDSILQPILTPLFMKLNYTAVAGLLLTTPTSLVLDLIFVPTSTSPVVLFAFVAA
jgi:hypothetical protein